MEILILVAMALLIPVTSSAQGLITSHLTPDAATAGMGFTSSTGTEGAWAGFQNPASWSQQPFLYSGVSTLDLWNNTKNGARMESGAAGIGLGGVVGGGFARQRLRFTDPNEPQFTIPGFSSEVTEYTDVFGGGIDMGKLLAPGNDYLIMAVGGNVKRQTRSYYTKCEDPVLVTEEYTNYDLGALIELRIPFHQGEELLMDGPVSYLNLCAGYMVNNASRDFFEEETQGTVNEAGYSVSQGLGFDLVLGRLSRHRHVISISGSYENWSYDQEFKMTDKTSPVVTMEQQDRYGVEVGIADVLFGRYGRVGVRDSDILETTYGAGLDLILPALGFRVSADYAHAPWLHGSLGGVFLTDEIIMMDRFSVQVAIGI